MRVCFGGRDLLIKHGLRKRLVLLCAAQGLIHTFQLCVQTHQKVQIALLLFRHLSKVLFLELRQRFVLVIQMLFCVRDLSRQEVRYALGLLLMAMKLLFDEKRSDIGADLLRQLRIV